MYDDVSIITVKITLNRKLRTACVAKQSSNKNYTTFACELQGIIHDVMKFVAVDSSTTSVPQSNKYSQSTRFICNHVIIVSYTYQVGGA